MNTKLLMTSSALVLGLAGILFLFMPDLVLSAQGVTDTGVMSTLVQLMGALYFAFALMNWTAKDGIICGIYARPVSLGNFAHFFAGALLLVKVQFSSEFNGLIFAMMIVYVIYVLCFYWLVFRATGIKPPAV
jgi:Fe2+ transport system protein B